MTLTRETRQWTGIGGLRAMALDQGISVECGMDSGVLSLVTSSHRTALAQDFHDIFTDGKSTWSVFSPFDRWLTFDGLRYKRVESPFNRSAR